MWGGMDRRRFPRANYPCLIKIHKKKEPEEFLTQTENIGCGGVCVILEKRLALFEDVALEIDLKDNSKPVATDGKAVWVVEHREPRKESQFDTGIEFARLKREDYQRIEKIVQICGQKEESTP